MAKEIQNKRVKDAINALVASWSREYQKNAGPLINRIVELIDGGVPVSKAIDRALDEVSFFGKVRASLENKLFLAAAQGYGILPSIVTQAAKTTIIKKLNTMPWAPDGMNLSERIHGTNQQTRQTINETISTAMKQGANMVKLSRELYDGYNYGKKINIAEVPKYLKRISDMSRRLALTTGDAKTDGEFQTLLRAAKRQADDLKTPALKAAVKQLLDKTGTASRKAVKKAAWVAVQEKSRYNAERIARTEIAKAWADGFLADKLEDEDVIGWRWRLSTAHKIYDICDFHAKANLYGLGPGVFPKDKIAPQPAHPHCTCHLEEIYDGELDGLTPKKDIDYSGQKFLEGLPLDARRSLLGSNNETIWRKGDAEWQSILKSWQGHEKPLSRLEKEDFKTKK